LNERKKELTHIGDVLSSALARYRPAKDTQMTKVWEIWDNTVGEQVSMNAKPCSFKDGILIVNVSSSAWVYQLKFLEKEMIHRINRQLDTPMIKKLKFKIGKILG
jgi:predicted nucleic acid-binding Zn ribbon protein